MNISRYQRSTSAISVGMPKLLACPRDLQLQAFIALLIRANVLLVQLLRSTTRTSRLRRCGSSSGSMTRQRRRRRPVAARRRQLVAAKRRRFRSCLGCIRVSGLPCSSAELSSAVGPMLMIRGASWTGTHACMSEQLNLL